MKEIKGDTDKWKDSLCPYYPKRSMNSVQTLSKFQWHFSEKNSPKIYMELQKTPNSQSNNEKKEQN